MKDIFKRLIVDFHERKQGNINQSQGDYTGIKSSVLITGNSEERIPADIA